MKDLKDFKKWNYGEYSSVNYGANSLAIQLGARTIYYSYDTIVAFTGTNSKGKYFNCIIKNYWGPTTGKHLNFINPDKKIRLDKEEFGNQLKEFLE